MTEQLIGPNQGFVANYETTLKPDEWAKRGQVMAYNTAATMPILHRLAREYAICDRWYCSVPAETYPNRLFTHCATSGGRVSDSLLWRWLPPKMYSMPSIFDRLGPGIDAWACYNDQIPNMLLLSNLADEFLSSRHKPDSHFRSLHQLEHDSAAGELPRYSFVEPKYLFDNPDDDHPPHPVSDGERLVARVYRAIRGGKDWERTLLLILFDEHGGFFDHREPPHSVPPPDNSPASGFEDGFAFTRFGPRVPCILVSAWTDKGRVFGSTDDTVYDHTSIIATLRDRWPDIGPLTARDAAATSLGPQLDRTAPRSDDEGVPAEIDALIAELAEPGPPIARAPRLHGRGGRTAATFAALAAPVSQLPLIRRAAPPGRRPRLERSTAGLAALVAIRSLRPRRRRPFDPGGSREPHDG